MGVMDEPADAHRLADPAPTSVSGNAVHTGVPCGALQRRTGCPSCSGHRPGSRGPTGHSHEATEGIARVRPLGSNGGAFPDPDVDPQRGERPDRPAAVRGSPLSAHLGVALRGVSWGGSWGNPAGTGTDQCDAAGPLYPGGAAVTSTGFVRRAANSLKKQPSHNTDISLYATRDLTPPYDEHMAPCFRQDRSDSTCKW